MGFCDSVVWVERLQGDYAFSIPCESWGSATRVETPGVFYSITFQYSLRIVGFCDRAYFPNLSQEQLRFQYSLRIVGFCDQDRRCARLGRQIFQYSLRIVGFCDKEANHDPGYANSNFQYSLRIVGFCDKPAKIPAPLRRRTFSIPCESWGSATPRRSFPPTRTATFQYSLRIVGFCDGVWVGVCVGVDVLSVFPANRGVLRHGMRPKAGMPPSAFSIPCESWGSATTCYPRTHL